MLYANGRDYLNIKHKSVALFGMSGVGKTHLARMLRSEGNWFHYSVDYRIATRYMSEPIVDNFKKEAMKNPFLAELLRSDSIYIASNITFENLSPLSTYLGKPGSAQRGGLPFEEYKKRQAEHAIAEIKSMKDIATFRRKSFEIYGYQDFIADCSGSLCEIAEGEKNCEVMKELSQHTLPVWIKGSEEDRLSLIERFSRAPKPMYYRKEFLEKSWANYLQENSETPQSVNPDKFIRWGYEKLIDERLPRYERLAENFGITITSQEVSAIQSPDNFNALIASKLG